MHIQRILIFSFASCLVLSSVRADVNSLLQSLLYKYVDDELENAGLVEKDITADLFKANRTGLPRCNDHHLMLRLAQRQITSPERIVQLVLDSCGDLVEVCREMKADIASTTVELKNCGPFQEDNLYWLLFNGVGEMFRQLCLTSSDLTSKISTNRKCVRYLREEFVDCEGPADWFEKDNDHVLCQTFEDVVNCHYIKTAELCGLDLASTMRTFSIDVINNCLRHQCTIPKTKPQVISPMPNPVIKHRGNAGRAIPLIYSYPYFFVISYFLVYILR